MDLEEQQRRVDEKHEDVVRHHSQKLGDRIDDNFRLRDEFAAENTYKFSDVIITIALGIVGVASFSNLRDLSALSKFLSLSLIFPIIVLILELKYRKDVLEINREAH